MTNDSPEEKMNGKTLLAIGAMLLCAAGAPEARANGGWSKPSDPMACHAQMVDEKAGTARLTCEAAEGLKIGGFILVSPVADLKPHPQFAYLIYDDGKQIIGRLDT